MAKQESNINKIIEIIQESPKTKDEIIEIMGFSAESWHKYSVNVRKRLKLEGKSLVKKQKKYSIISLLSGDPHDVASDQRVSLSSEKTIKEVLVLNSLSAYSVRYRSRKNGVVSISEMANDIYLNELNGSGKKYRESLNFILNNNRQNNEGLVARGLVRKFSGADGAKYDLTVKAPVFIKLDDNQFFNLRHAIQNAGQGYPFSDVLFAIDNQMSICDDDKIDIKQGTSSIGVKASYSPNILKFLEKLNKSNFKDYESKLTLKAKSNTTSDKKEIVFGIGLVVYVCDKDRLYFLGEEHNKNKIKIINTDNIFKIEDSEFINKEYDSHKYKKIFEEMFSISIEPPFDIKVEFDNALNIPAKLKRLREVRPNAFIEIKPGDDSKIIYREKNVRGLEDVARWLRSFGKSARVIEPKMLRDRMKESIEKTLREYGEV